ncbi:transporter substrate-binding domain-containing protein [Roseomonas sp. USHLN139]|uniref:transporter substrate-binding domain-containing protein n=1 Tax=Roseomonas sp. USHLN139 TaxID=3081298 RepID=UPI003B01169E
MNRRTLLAAGTALALAPLARPALADALDSIRARKKLLIAIDLGNPPFGQSDAQMQPTGSDVETGKLLAADWGMPMELVQVTGPNRVPFLLTGKADMVIASFSVTPEREKVIDFSAPYGVIQIVVAAKKGVEIKDLASLAGKRVGTTRGSSNDKEFTDRNTGAQIIRYDDDATLITALVSGQVDIMATSPQVMQAANQRHPQAPFEVKITLKTNNYAIGIRKGETALQTELNSWISANLKNGKLNEIYKKFLGVDLPPAMLA